MTRRVGALATVRRAMIALFRKVAAGIGGCARRVWSRLAPMPEAGPTLGLATDACRTRRELLLENAVLRHQINVLRRKRPRPKLTRTDRLGLLLASALLPGWRNAVALVQPATILRWHRRRFEMFWRFKSRPAPGSPPPARTIGLIRDMAHRNRLWGAERIRACDFLQTYDLLFRPVFAFFVVHVGSRRVVHVGTTRCPTQRWTAQQLRNATMDGNAPRFILRDRDDKYGAEFDRVAQGVGARVIRTAVRAPNMNAIVERFLRSVRSELLDHLVILDDRQLANALREYVGYFNGARPHQGLGQCIPARPTASANQAGRVIAIPLLNGLHHDYRRAA
jgi:putative transposase